ncbi:MAG: hypothetical protein OXF01_13225 [Gemmatimonadetes bacterium]|nr:hypothetical protein [Gemmatimonadota bacterium]
MSNRSVTRDEVVDCLNARHARFFAEVGVDTHTGILHRREMRRRVRFKSYPYIGSRYGDESPRILFVGQHDPTDEGNLVSFERRRQHVEDKARADHNPHIAGTWFQALSLLPPEYGWASVADSTRPCQSLLRRPLPMEAQWADPLLFVALTNWNKWVEVGSGAFNRHLAEDAERALLIDEVRCCEPEIVIFQGKLFLRPARLRAIRSLASDFDVRVWPHPSHRARRRPRDVVEALWP